MTQRNATDLGKSFQRNGRQHIDGANQVLASPFAHAGMKYAICNLMFSGWQLDRVFDFVRDCGYTGVEIAPFTLAPRLYEISVGTRAKVRRLAERSDVQVIGLHQSLNKTEGLHLTTCNAEVRRKTAIHLADSARLCRDLGGSIVAIGSPLQRNREPGVTTEMAMCHAAEIIHAALPVFEECGVVMALEPLGPTESNFLISTAEGFELMQMVGSVHCKLLLDCKGMAGAGESIPDTLREFHHHMVHFHANDPNRQGPGFGDLDFGPIMAALRQIDWQGWISVEAFDYSSGVERVARESIQTLRMAMDQATGP